MRAAILAAMALFAIFASPAEARKKTHAPLYAALMAPESLAYATDAACHSVVADAIETSRTCTLSAEAYQACALRVELDVQFGPTEVDKVGTETVSTWSDADPVHQSEMRRRHLSKISLVRAADGSVVVQVDAERSAVPDIQTASK